jgi:hypothetical protein
MYGHRPLCAVLLAVGTVVSLLHAGGASATAQRTFVASTGNDAAPCSLAQPCRSFAAAINNTNSGGEVIVLDSAGYGKVTITKAVSIIAPPGLYGGMSVFAGQNGITVNAAASDKVTLRGLTINGQGGDDGILFFTGGELEIDRCVISGMGLYGISVASTAGATTITDTVVERSASFGIIFFDRFSGSSRGLLTSVRVVDNGHGGLQSGGGAQLRVRDSVFQRNGSFGVRVLTGVANASVLDMAHSFVADNGSTGVLLVAGAVAAPIKAVIADNVITDHADGGVDASTMSSGIGSIQAMLIRNSIRGLATAKGIRAFNSNTELLLLRNAVSQTSTGVAAENSAVVQSRGNNIVDGNTTNQTGAILPANAL